MYTFLQEIPNSSDTAQGAASPPDVISIEGILRFVFSGLVLMAISVILSGKFLAQRIKLPVRSSQLFQIPLPGILKIGATDDEVILGFTGLIITLLATGSLFGKRAHVFFSNNFGIDPGQFNSLCILSAFLAVIWSFVLFLLLGIRSQSNLEPVADKHAEIVRSLTERSQRGDRV
ncbi:MAG TPA: hypothetical protein VF746_28755 [Longimicrobium sp.]|jgi:hypothetical protein